MNDLKVLSKLIECKSDSNPNEIIDCVKNLLGEKVEEMIEVFNKEDNKKNLIVGINTKLKDVEAIVLSGHIDTVGADMKKYETNPYRLTIKDDKAYGLGIIDMKCFTSSVIDLIENIKEKYVPVVMVLTGDEETNLYGVENVINKFKELNIKPKFTIIGEPTSFEIKDTSNGCFEYKVEVYGKSCHSSKPEEGINSICVVARIISYIEDLSKTYSNLTMSCDLIEGGTIINRVPDYASVSFDIRTTSIDKYDEAINYIEKELKRLEGVYGCLIKMENKLRIPPLSKNNEKCIKQVSEKLNVKVSNFLGGCEAGYYKEYGGDAILFGLGDLNLAHKPNEYMVIKDYEKYNRMLLLLLDEVINNYF